MTVLAQTGPHARAGVLIEALPYMRAYRGTTIVVKIGGEALQEERTAGLLAQDLTLLALVGVRLVVVHGGGPQLTTAMKAAGVEARFVDGLRVTDPESMQIVRQVLIGSINSDLVGLLCASGLSAIGLSGIDAGVLIGRRLLGSGGRSLGEVGSVEAVRSEVIESLLDAGHTPVLASVAADASGKPLNVNADSVAGAIASALGATKLVYLTNVEGLYRDLGDAGSLISEMTAKDLHSLLASLSDGMQPKARGAIEALGRGVQKVHILDGRVEHALLLEIFTNDGVGTQVLP
ncbi:MAG: acetylglutamate kinase [Actinomycetota bacterium]|nr:acetylglutamate kinase [Actinomycetota bacterium]